MCDTSPHRPTPPPHHPLPLILLFHKMEMVKSWYCNNNYIVVNYSCNTIFLWSLTGVWICLLLWVCQVSEYNMVLNMPGLHRVSNRSWKADITKVIINCWDKYSQPSIVDVWQLWLGYALGSEHASGLEYAIVLNASESWICCWFRI